LKEECDSTHFRDEFSVEKKSLCGTVRFLNIFAPRLKTELEANEIVNYSAKIRDTINYDAIKLRHKYYALLGYKVAEQIRANVNQIANGSLILAFKDSYHEFIEEMKNPAIVFKLLLIGKKVAEMFKTSKAEKQQALAYQQFAINLTIHSIDIGHTKHDIRAIAAKWPVQWEKLILG
jgi:hypothetical protein